MSAISIVIFGYLRYDKYRRRPCDLEFFIKLLGAYRLELKWSQKSLGEIIRAYNDKKYESYINEAVLLLNGQNGSGAYTDDNKYFAQMSLSHDDIDVIKYFFSQSGKGSLMAELALCDKTIALLEDKKQEAAAEFNRQGPLILKLSAIGGAWLVVMLL